MVAWILIGCRACVVVGYLHYVFPFGPSIKVQFQRRKGLQSHALSHTHVIWFIWFRVCLCGLPEALKLNMSILEHPTCFHFSPLQIARSFMLVFNVFEELQTHWRLPWDVKFDYPQDLFGSVLFNIVGCVFNYQMITLNMHNSKWCAWTQNCVASLLQLQSPWFPMDAFLLLGSYTHFFVNLIHYHHTNFCYTWIDVCVQNALCSCNVVVTFLQHTTLIYWATEKRFGNSTIMLGIYSKVHAIWSIVIM